MVVRKRLRRGALFVVLCLFFIHAMELDALARAGSGRTSGSRGSRPASPPSRSYSVPSQPQPSQQQRHYNNVPPTTSAPSPSPFWHGLAGGLLGGLVGGMLFRGLGFAGTGASGWGGPGLLDLVLIGVLLYGIYWFVVKRRKAPPVLEPLYASCGSSQVPEPVTLTVQDGEAREGTNYQEILTGINHIRQMDPGFDLEHFKEQAMDIFFKIQAAWSQRDMAPCRDNLTEEMYRSLQGQLEELRAQGRFNRLENVAVRAVEPVEVWQESGQDFITVRILANLVDYVVDEATGHVVSGDAKQPVKFEEYWTFTREVGPNPWRLSAIVQP